MGSILIAPFVDIKNMIMGVMKFIKNALKSNLFADLISGPTEILNGLTKVFDFLSSGKRLGLLEKLSLFLDGLKQTIQLLPSTFLAVITSLNKAFSLSGALDGIKVFLRIFKMQIGKLAVMVTNSFQAIRKAFSLSNTLERLKSSFTNIFSMLMKQADQLPAKLLDALRPISRIMLSQILPSVFNGMQAILENFKPIFLNQIIFQIYLI